MKKIALSGHLGKGLYTIVDDGDYQHLAKWKWFVGYRGYVYRSGSEGGLKRNISMHRLIAATPRGSLTDHRNRNKLDNRRSNLRTSTNSLNQANSRPQDNTQSGYKGVSWDKANAKWRARIQVNGKKQEIGLFHSRHFAAKAYNVCSILYFGEFARLNELSA
jgi:hypothetical protein